MTVCALDARLPPPSASGELLQVSDGVTFIEADDGSGSVFLWGSAGWTWAAGDRVGRRLAAVQLVATKAAPQRRVAAAFGVNEDTLLLWRGQYATNGVTGLAGRRPGPKGPSKLTEAKRTEISALRAEGLTLHAVAERVSVSTDSVRRALARGPQLVRAEEPVGEGALGPHCRPAGCSVNHAAESARWLMGDHPVLCDGHSLPLGGSLIILPALAATALLEAAAGVYDVGGADVEGLRTVMLSTVLSCLLSDRRVEAPMGLDPTDAARLLGLDRPELDTMHRRLQELAALGRSDWLIGTLAGRHLEARRQVEGIFCRDGHVDAYRRSAEVAEDDLPRIRLSMGAEIDAHLLDRNGDGVLLWTAPADDSAIGHLRTVIPEVRELAGPTAQPTICFERGGWPPKLFAELAAARFDVVTYGKGGAHAESLASFQWHSFTDAGGSVHPYLLADGEAQIGYDGGRRRFTCRQIIGLEPHSGQQTQILTTRADPEPATIAHAMLRRSAQERFMDTMRTQRGADALDRFARATPAPNGVGTHVASLAGERERINEAVRMATYNAESALTRLLVPRHASSGDEARSLLGQAFRTPADVQIIGDELHVHVNPISSPRDARAMAALCAELTTTKTVYPGSTLTLVYSTEQGAVDMD